MVGEVVYLRKALAAVPFGETYRTGIGAVVYLLETVHVYLAKCGDSTSLSILDISEKAHTVEYACKGIPLEMLHKSMLKYTSFALFFSAVRDENS